MSPDPNSHFGRLLDPSRPKRFDRNIPQPGAVETHDLRDKEVNMQVGAFIAAPVLGVVLVLRPEAYEFGAAAVGLLLAATRRSYLRYRRLRTT
ncbi:hypothetical protein GCM10018772_27970 [Streptomyces fumanus]|uniref:Uncharacterized protein n=2 Tax=Streptomyces fumanus TaxID=67302 RepID=A0A919AFF9_9ACTN|nr:hypothetical protein GCM10018772_27970 [Streptomyces fumanus]